MASNFINISTDSTDPFFRYKMQPIAVKHEGRGNGVKTVISNMEEISKSLDRDGSDLLQYIASELSVSSVLKNGFYTLNGTFSVSTLQEILQRFVASHVLCGVCDNPETVFRISKKDDSTLFKVCAACGARSKTSSHKLNKKIISRLTITGKEKKSETKKGKLVKEVSSGE